MFENKRWQLRWVAAGLILKMSETPHVGEFMDKLSVAKNMAMSEPLVYGPLLGELKGSPKPEVLVDKYSTRENPIQARLTALAYYYRHGTKSQLGKVDAFANDRTRVPSCAEDATDCEWECTVQEGGTSASKEVATLGDFVNYCVKPAMEKREKIEGDPKKQ
jgi:hypothetical protein